MSRPGDPLRKLAVDLRGVGVNSRRMARVAIQKICADTKRDAQSIVAVDTGALKSSITYETRSNKGSVVGEVGPTQDYGIFVEMGTSRMGPQPFMRPAFDRQAPVLEQVMSQLKVGELE